MAVSRVGGDGQVAGGGVIRPMYGVFIRDQVAKYRSMLNVTLKDLKAGIKAGDPRGTVVRGDGILQGKELTQAKKAALAVDKAIKALKPVFGNSAPRVSDQAARNALGRPGGGFVAMYGVIMADDLRKYRTELSTNIDSIKTAVKKGELKGDAKTEATKAIRNLTVALKALQTAGTF